MTDRKALPTQQNETPEDVATLYSWANLHGAKYRDFSASRAQTREKARLRAQQAQEQESERVRQQAEASRLQEAARLSEPPVSTMPSAPAPAAAAPQSRQLPVQPAVDEASVAAQAAHAAQVAQAAQAAAQAARAAQQAQQAAQEMARRAAQPIIPPPPQPVPAQAPQQAARVNDWQAPAYDRYAAPPTAIPEPYYPPQPSYSAYPTPQQYRPAAAPSQFTPVREEYPAAPQNPWAQPEPRETANRPAWLTSERADVSSQPSALQAPEDTLQGSRDRLASRWFALKGVFDGVSAPVEQAPAPSASRAPVVAVFSLAGGVGKTSIVATLGRALSARGERVLLVDTASFGLLPFFFGAQDQRPGQLRTFSPPAGGGDAPIQLVTIDPDAMGPENPAQETLTGEIQKYSRGAGRVIVDLATASGATTRRILKMNPLVLVPVIPDMNSVVSVSSIDAFFQRNGGAAGSAHMPYYVLNQFDPSLPLHLDVREILRERLGDRLLPFALRRAPSVSEAMAEGMTVMDYAPNSTVAEDFGSLAGWVKSLSAPASSGFRGVRWSER